MHIDSFFALLTAQTKERLLDYGYAAVSRILRREEELRRQLRREMEPDAEDD